MWTKLASSHQSRSLIILLCAGCEVCMERCPRLWARLRAWGRGRNTLPQLPEGSARAVSTFHTAVWHLPSMMHLLWSRMRGHTLVRGPPGHHGCGADTHSSHGRKALQTQVLTGGICCSPLSYSISPYVYALFSSALKIHAYYIQINTEKLVLSITISC